MNSRQKACRRRILENRRQPFCTGAVYSCISSPERPMPLLTVDRSCP